MTDGGDHAATPQEIDPRIHLITMPKWGLSMKVGKVIDWIVAEGDPVSVGDDLADIETEKIAGTLESSAEGVLRRIIAEPRRDIPVSGVIALVAPPEVEDAAIEAAAGRAGAELDRLAAAVAAGEDGEDGPVISTLTVGRHTVSYASVGDGEGARDAVLLVHGYGGDRASWLFVQEPLAGAGTTGGRSVHAVDLPGHGESSKTLTETATLDELAEVVLAVLDRVAPEGTRAHLVGHSLGGAVVAAAAARAPGRVTSLTLIAPAGFGGRPDVEYLRGFADAGSRRELKPLLGKLFADASQVTRQLVDDVLKYKRLDGVTTSLEAALGILLDPHGGQAIDTAATVRELRDVPVAVVWGAQDAVLPVPAADVVELAVLDLVPQAGHMVHLEAPAVVLDVLERQVRAG